MLVGSRNQVCFRGVHSIGTNVTCVLKKTDTKIMQVFTKVWEILN